MVWQQTPQPSHNMATATATATATENVEKMIKELAGRYTSEVYDKELCDFGGKWIEYSSKSCEKYVGEFLMGKEPIANALMCIRAGTLVEECRLNQEMDKEELETHTPYVVFLTMDRLLRERNAAVGESLKDACSFYVQGWRQHMMCRLGGWDGGDRSYMPLAIYRGAYDDLKRAYDYGKGGEPLEEAVVGHAVKVLRTVLAEDALASSPEEMRKRLMAELGEQYEKEERDEKLCHAALKWWNFNREACEGFIEDFQMGDEKPEATWTLGNRALELVVAHPLNKGSDRELLKVHAHYVIFRTLERMLPPAQRVVGESLLAECVRVMKDEEEKDDAVSFLEEWSVIDEDGVPTKFPPTPPTGVFEKAKEDLMAMYKYGYGQTPSVDEICRHAAAALSKAVAAVAPTVPTSPASPTAPTAPLAPVWPTAPASPIAPVWPTTPASPLARASSKKTVSVAGSGGAAFTPEKAGTVAVNARSHKRKFREAVDSPQ